MNKMKQVIVIRKDLKMRKGKIVTQGSHASFGVFRNIMKKEKISDELNKYSFEANLDSSEWLDIEFTKICVTVNSEEELLDIVRQAKDKELLHCLITDAGHTEFHGVPTKTCCAIGPTRADIVDKITGHLPLL